MRCATKLRQMSVIRNEQNEGRYRSGKASRAHVVFWLLNGHQTLSEIAIRRDFRNETGSGNTDAPSRMASSKIRWTGNVADDVNVHPLLCAPSASDIRMLLGDAIEVTTSAVCGLTG